MGRKVVRHGVSLMVSLPSRWVKRTGVKAGDELDIDERKVSLNISTINLKKEGVQINLDECDKYGVRSALSLAYSCGFDRIILTIKGEINLTLINDVVKTFTGLEVIEQKGNKIIIQSFFKDEPKQIEKIIIKMFQLNNTMLSELKIKWVDVNLIDLENYFDFLLRLRDNVLRMININTYGDERSYDYYLLVMNLSMVSRAIFHLSKYVSSSNIRRRNFLNIICDSSNNLYKCYLRKNPIEIKETWKKMNQLMTEKIGFDENTELAKERKPMLVAHFYNCISQFS